MVWCRNGGDWRAEVAVSGGAVVGYDVVLGYLKGGSCGGSGGVVLPGGAAMLLWLWL